MEGEFEKVLFDADKMIWKGKVLFGNLRDG